LCLSQIKSEYIGDAAGLSDFDAELDKLAMNS